MKEARNENMMTRNEFRKMAEEEGYTDVIEKLNRVESYNPQQIILYIFNANALCAEREFDVDLNVGDDIITEVWVKVSPGRNRIIVKGQSDDEESEEYTLLDAKLSDVKFDLQY